MDNLKIKKKGLSFAKIFLDIQENLVMSKTELPAFSVHPFSFRAVGEESLGPAEVHAMEAPLPCTV